MRLAGNESNDDYGTISASRRLPARRSIRWRSYDYTERGGYFVTLCTYDRRCLLGEVSDDAMRPSAIGSVVIEEWLRTEALRNYVHLDLFALMPNHLHAILLIEGSGLGIAADHAVSAADIGQAKGVLRRPHSLGSIIGGFRGSVTRRARKMYTADMKVWQRNYWEHVIRGYDELVRIQQYIVDNPKKWALDPENPSRGPR